MGRSSLGLLPRRMQRPGPGWGVRGHREAVPWAWPLTRLGLHLTAAPDSRPSLPQIRRMISASLFLCLPQVTMIIIKDESTFQLSP